MKIGSVMAAIVVMGSVALFAFGNTADAPNERLLTRLPQKNEPIAIIEMSVNGETISFGRHFVAADDWMRTLVITVKNTSSKRILFLNFDLFLKFPERPNERFVLFDQLSYGNWALQRRPPSADDRLVGIAPGESVAVQLADKQFANLLKFVTEVQLPGTIDKVHLKIGRIIFEDDTMWSDEMFRRDPTDPSNWHNVGP